MRPTRLMLAAALLVSGCGAPAASLGTGVQVADSDAVLSQLVVAEEDTGAHYRREDWHIGWGEQGDGCDTRDIVLIEQGDGEVQDNQCRLVCPARDCWRSPYDDTLHSVARGLDIDHRVPLGEAARSRVVMKGWCGRLRRGPGVDRGAAAFVRRGPRQSGGGDREREPGEG